MVLRITGIIPYSPFFVIKRKKMPRKSGASGYETQQQELELQPQPQLLPPQLLLPLPQQHQMIISRMMIQQQLPPPKPLLHI